MPGRVDDRDADRAASPERGWTKATYPSGSAMLIPVGTMARSPGSSVTSTVVVMSAPASPGCAYDGRSDVWVDPRIKTSRPHGADLLGRRRPPYRRLLGRLDPAWQAFATMTSPGRPTPRRLHAPSSWWLLGAGFVVAVWWAFFVATPAWATVVATIVAAAIVVGGLASVRQAQVSWSTPADVVAGRSRHLPRQFVGAVEAARRRGRTAAARGRGRRPGVPRDPAYIKGAVKVEVADAATRRRTGSSPRGIPSLRAARASLQLAPGSRRARGGFVATSKSASPRRRPTSTKQRRARQEPGS